MKIFTPMYNMVVAWAGHKRAPWFLAGLSFAESSFFPVPVDAMLAPMAINQPKKWWQFALLAAVMSVLGGLLGYAVGVWFWYILEPWFISWGLMPVYNEVVARISSDGIWVLFLASFTPIPYKVATIAAGSLSMHLLPFVLVSLIGRGLRFALVSALMAFFGAKLEPKLKQYMEWLGWLTIIVFVLGYGIYKLV